MSYRLNSSREKKNQQNNHRQQKQNKLLQSARKIREKHEKITTAKKTRKNVYPLEIKSRTVANEKLHKRFHETQFLERNF